MALNKFSNKSDKIANLYRAAFYLAKGSTDVALDFLNKSEIKLSNLRTNTEQQRIFWAEKILDEYIHLKHLEA